MVGGFTAFRSIGNFDKVPLARRVFGKDDIDEAVKWIADVLGGWGYRIGRAKDQRLPAALCLALLLNPSPRLEDLTTGVFERLRLHPELARSQAAALHRSPEATRHYAQITPNKGLNQWERAALELADERSQLG
jgi:hypothetical protein